MNFFYDNSLGNGSCTNDSPVSPTREILNHCEVAGVPFTIGKHEQSLYVIELFYVQRLSEVFANISSEALALLQQGKLKLVIYFPSEGFRLNLYDNWCVRLHECFKEYKLQNTEKYFIYNNLNIKQQYEDLKQANELVNSYCFNEVFSFPFFEFNSKQIDPKPNLDLERTTDFTCFNGKVRAHRLFLLSEFKRRDLLDCNFTSLIGDTWQHHENTVEFVLAALKSTFKGDSANIIPTESRHFVETFGNAWKPYKIANIDVCYAKSYLNVVSETGMDHYLRITSKTMIPIANYQPFIIVGAHGTLSYLRSVGYQTFPEFFDETYDDETNLLKRLMMVLDQVEAFCGLSEADKIKRFNLIKDKLIHNANLFYNVRPRINNENYRALLNRIIT